MGRRACRRTKGQNPTAARIVDTSSTDVGLRFAHIWVEACVAYAHYRGARFDNARHRWIPLDPSFETRRDTDKVATSERFDFDAYLIGFNTRLPHEVYENQVRGSLTGSADLEDVGYRSDKTPIELDILPASLPYSFTD